MPTRSVALLLLLGTLSCRAGRPTEADGKDALTAAIHGKNAAALTIRSFRKTDGQNADLMGVKVYLLEFEAVAEFVAEAAFSSNGRAIDVVGPLPTLAEQKPGFSWDAYFNSAVAGRAPGFRADRLFLKGTVEFQNKESGWVAGGVSFTITADTSRRERNPAAAPANSRDLTAGAGGTIGPPASSVARPEAGSRAILAGHWEAVGGPDCLDFSPHRSADSVTVSIYYCEAFQNPAQFNLGPLGPQLVLFAGDSAIYVQLHASADTIEVSPTRALSSKEGNGILRGVQNEPRPQLFHRIRQ